ncbi:hypothetical protein NEAUS04_0785 [Nematocida ausubeli]|nr:hypothetical protein NEAUS04_0785 [Nematocida ausubeli]
MKLFWIINLMIARAVFARLDLKDMEYLQNLPIGVRNAYIIRADGPLNPLRANILDANGYMQCKRFFSPEIEVDYKLEKNLPRGAVLYKYDFTRCPEKDKAYVPVDTKKANYEYLSKYHTTLIKMFPSEQGYLSIITKRQDSLYQFLISPEGMQNAKYILASLLLLSEGIDISLSFEEINEEKHLVLTNQDRTSVIFSTRMCTSYANAKNSTMEDVYHSEVADIFEFFRDWKDCPALKEGGIYADPTNFNDFLKGRFLNGMRFLIQTYIFKFVDNQQDYAEFIEAVYYIIMSHLPKNFKELPENDPITAVFHKCFVKNSDASAEMEYIMSLCDLKKTIYDNTAFPFYPARQIPPSYMKVLRNRQENEDVSKIQEIYRMRSVETSILGLFCCLAYDPETKKYTTEHMGNISSSLAKFFAKFSSPSDINSHKMHEEWSEVLRPVRMTRNPENGDKHEIVSGLLSILNAVLALTEKKPDVLTAYTTLQSICYDKKVNALNLEEIKRSILIILNPLLKNKRVKIISSLFTIGKSVNGKPDIFAKIQIESMDRNIQKTMVLNIDPDVSYLSFAHNSINISTPAQNKLAYIKTKFLNMDTYLGYAISIYAANAEIEIATCKIRSVSISMQKIEKLIRGSNENINQVFMHGLSYLLRNQVDLFKSFLISSLSEDLPSDNPMVRFTYNILGSMALDELETRRRILLYFVYNRYSTGYYPGIDYFLDNWALAEPTESDIFSTFNNIIDLHSSEIMSLCLASLIKIPNSVYRTLDLLRSSPSAKIIFDIIFEYGSISHLSRIHHAMNKSWPPGIYSKNLIPYMWFSFACSQATRDITFIKYTYNLIDPLAISDDEITEIYEYADSEKILEFLIREKNTLIIEDSKKSLEKYYKLKKHFTSISPNSSIYQKVSASVFHCLNK